MISRKISKDLKCLNKILTSSKLKHKQSLFIKQTNLQTKNIKLVSSKSYFSRQNSYLTHSLCFTFITSNHIENLNEVKTASKYLSEGRYKQAIAQFEMALKFLPTSLQGNQSYTAQYDKLLQNLLIGHVYLCKPISQYQKLQAKNLISPKLSSFIALLSLLQTNPSQLTKPSTLQQTVCESVIKAFAYKLSGQCYGKHVDIVRIRQDKDFWIRVVGLNLYQRINNRKSKEREDTYLNACRELLKDAENIGPMYVVKPLMLMAANLYAGDQFLQAEGLYSHCLSTLEQFYAHNPALLKLDQQYIYCKLSIGKVFQKVKRQAQNAKIIQEFSPLYDEKKHFIQGITKIDYNSL